MGHWDEETDRESPFVNESYRGEPLRESSSPLHGIDKQVIKNEGYGEFLGSRSFDWGDKTTNSATEVKVEGFVNTAEATITTVSNVAEKAINLTKVSFDATQELVMENLFGIVPKSSQESSENNPEDALDPKARQKKQEDISHRNAFNQAMKENRQKAVAERQNGVFRALERFGLDGTVVQALLQSGAEKAKSIVNGLKSKINPPNLNPAQAVELREAQVVQASEVMNWAQEDARKEAITSSSTNSKFSINLDQVSEGASVLSSTGGAGAG